MAYNVNSVWIVEKMHDPGPEYDKWELYIFTVCCICASHRIAVERRELLKLKFPDDEFIVRETHVHTEQLFYPEEHEERQSYAQVDRTVGESQIGKHEPITREELLGLYIDFIERSLK